MSCSYSLPESFLGGKKGFSHLSREIWVLFHGLIVLLAPKKRVLRPLVEVLLEQLVQNQRALYQWTYLHSTVSINRSKPLTVTGEWWLVSLTAVWGWTYKHHNCVALICFWIIFKMLLKDNWGVLPCVFCWKLLWDTLKLAWRKFLIYSAVFWTAGCLYLGHCTDIKVEPQRRGGLNASVRTAFLSTEN